MRAIITECHEALATPPASERMAALTSPMTQSDHDRWMHRWPCMNALEVRQSPSGAASPTGPVKVLAWNMERCKHVEASATLISQRGVDVVLATEMDWGCVRSGQRHTTAELSTELGLGYVFGVEFVELALGDTRETAEHADQQNLHGLHGNAVLSRFPIGRSVLIPLDDGGLWFNSDLKQGQRRIGGRNAIAAEILAPKDVSGRCLFISRASPRPTPERLQRNACGMALIGRQREPRSSWEATSMSSNCPDKD